MPDYRDIPHHTVPMKKVTLTDEQYKKVTDAIWVAIDEGYLHIDDDITEIFYHPYHDPPKLP